MKISEDGKEKTKGGKVLKCSCSHPYQDTVFGNGKRWHNLTTRGTGDSKTWRCTVCKTVRNG